MGSVKNLEVVREPVENEEGEGIFEFTDDFSVFDYGKMPDTIPGKGEALCRMASYNFGRLAINSHFLGFAKPNRMRVRLVRRVGVGERNRMVPLEVMFRNELPAGSSVFKRLASGALSLADLGVKNVPKPGEVLPRPIVDVSTKYETTDRYLGWKEARDIAGISEAQLAELKALAVKVNGSITSRANAIGLRHADGKMECALDGRGRLMVVDVFGTLDENRFIFQNDVTAPHGGVHLSKQVLRDHYKSTKWFMKLESAKEAGMPKSEWPAPPRLPKELVKLVSDLYKSTTEAWTGEKVWGAPKIAEVVDAYGKFVK